MKKGNIILSLILIIIMSISMINALNANDYKDIRECKKQCSIDKNNDLSDIKTIYDSCIIDCKSVKRIDKQICIFKCNEDKTFLKNRLGFFYEKCSLDCTFKIQNKNVSCLDGLYSVGDIFLDGCNICRCDYNSKIKCIKTPYCNFDKILDNKDLCTDNNGLYQEICNGPYFDIVCSKSSFCLCSGLNNYNCPDGYECVKNFTLSLNRRDNTIPGYKDHSGNDLGQIGICAKRPDLTSCGNNVCDNLVISILDVAETKFNCPIDC